MAEKMFPIGKPEVFKDREKLPSVEVKNKVFWINPNFPHMPLRLEVGKPSKLGYFLTPSEHMIVEKKQPMEDMEGNLIEVVPYFDYETVKTRNVEVRAGQARNSLPARVLFQDKDGRQYRDISLKGTGLINSAFKTEVEHFMYPGYVTNEVDRMGVIPPMKGEGDHSMGIRDKRRSLKDKEEAEHLTSLGVRTHRVLAIIDLEEIASRDWTSSVPPRKMSIQEAKDRGLISHKVDPVVEVRAFGTVARLLERPCNGLNAKTEECRTMQQLLGDLEDAKYLVAQEMKIDPEKFDDYSFFKWLANTLGRNLGIMHRSGFIQGPESATMMNLTLDGRIVDFDAVRMTDEPKEFEREHWDMVSALEDSLMPFFVACKVTKNKDYSIEEHKKLAERCSLGWSLEYDSYFAACSSEDPTMNITAKGCEVGFSRGYYEEFNKQRQSEAA